LEFKEWNLRAGYEVGEITSYMELTPEYKKDIYGSKIKN